MAAPGIAHDDDHPQFREILGRRTFLVLMAGCLTIALAVRWLFLGAESFWFDEGWTWWLITHSPREMLRLMRADTVAPAYFYTLHFWVTLVGDSEAGIRSLSALLMTVALVPWSIVVRRSLSSRLPIVVAAAFVAWSAMECQYAREARPYALLTVFTLSALACIPTVTAKRSWPAMIGFALFISAGMYTHNVMGFYAVCLAGAWLVWPGARPFVGRCVDLAIVVALCIAAYAPWLPFLRDQAKFVDGNFWVTQPGAAQVCVIVSTVFGVDDYDVSSMFWRLFNRSPGAGTLGVFVTTCTAVVIVLAVWRSDAVARRKAIALSIVTVGPIFGVFLYSQFKQPIFLGRLFVNSSALLPILLGMSLEHRRLRSVWFSAGAIAFALAALGIAGTYSLLESSKKENWRGLAQYVASLPPTPKRLIVFTAAEGELPYLYYAQHDPNRTPEHYTGTPGGFFELDPPRTIQRVNSDADLNPLRAQLAAGGYDEVVLVLSHYERGDPDQLTQKWLTNQWTLAANLEFRHVRAIRFLAK